MSTSTREARLNKQADEVDALKQRQLSGDIETIPGNTPEGSAESYTLPKEEAGFVHLRVIKKENDSRKREYVETINTVLKETPRDFESRNARKAYGHYDSVVILHDPREKDAEPKVKEPKGEKDAAPPSEENKTKTSE